MILNIYSPPHMTSAILSGPTSIQRGAPYDPGDGMVQIETEIVSMNLTGFSDMGMMTASTIPMPQSLGLIKQQASGNDYPAESFFDIFYRIELPSVGFQGEAKFPTHHESTINQIPPYGSIYVTNPLQPVPLFDPLNPTDPPIGELIVQFIRVGQPPAPPIEIEIIQLDLQGAGMPILQNSTLGRVQLTMTPPESLKYVNIVADSAGSGVPKWIAQNLPIIPYYLDSIPHCFKTIFDFATIGAVQGIPVSAINIEATLSDIPLTAMPSPMSWTTYAVGDGLYSAEGRPGGPYVFSGGIGDMTLLDFTIPYPIRVECRPGMPNVEAGTNECAPAAAANSFAWLASGEGFSGMPQSRRFSTALKTPAI